MGRPPDKLMSLVIQKIKVGGAKGWKCIGVGCSHERKGNATVRRVFSHSAVCKYLQKSHNALYQQVLTKQSSNSLGARRDQREATDGATATSGSVTKTIHTSTTAHSVPLVKKLKMNIEDDRMQTSIKPTAEAGGRQKRSERLAQMQEDVDFATMKLICVRGIVPSVVDSPEWKERDKWLSPEYRSTSSSIFVERFIPQEAAHVRKMMMQRLSTEDYITISFDGGNTRRDSIYLFHATTADRDSYFIAAHIGSTDRHDTKWVVAKIKEVRILLPPIEFCLKQSQDG